MFDEAYQEKNVELRPKFISKKDYKKIVAELTQLFYAYYSQRSRQLVSPTIEISTSCSNKEAA
jgi:hypothetical protein